ncbi:MAG: cephalosporin hydroxylase family protein, partial [Candidatus Eremiobacteraeota bacterium]|nr:cephalosporin hydroxylase family protein [Candidatus Eremiobacteraeota bacterium]
VLDLAGIDAEIVSVDIDDLVHPTVRTDPNIRFIHDSSTSPAVREALRETIARRPGRIFAIVDSDHRAEHVYGELMLLREFLKPGDYLIVEDGNINGHPVLPDWGPGPYEAVERYEREFPDDYRRDREREEKFGFTFAPRGFLVRR